MPWQWSEARSTASAKACGGWTGAICYEQTNAIELNSFTPWLQPPFHQTLKQRFLGTVLILKCVQASLKFRLPPLAVGEFTEVSHMLDGLVVVFGRPGCG